MPPSKPDNAKIHIAKKELGLSDEEYRDILWIRYKKDSSAKLSSAQGRDLVEHFKTLGFKVKRKKNSTASPKYKDAAMRKVVAIWITLHQAKVIHNKSDRALQAYIKRQTGKDNLLWCDGDEVRQLIESLKSWAQREDVDLD